MTRRESLLREMDDVPDSILDEVADFVNFLEARVARASTLTSTSTSASDGLTIAADALKAAYETDSELTAFTTLCNNEYRQNG